MDYYIMTTTGFYILLSFLSLGILIKIYMYLHKLESCNCFNDTEAHNIYKLDIDFLKAYQILEMILLSIFIFIIACFQNDNILTFKHVKRLPPRALRFITIISILLLLLVNSYITLNSFILYSVAKGQCYCVNKWQKYFIYTQGVFSSVTFLRLLYTLIFVIILLPI